MHAHKNYEPTIPELERSVISDEVLDPIIAPVVRILRKYGVSTFESCQGGAHHGLPVPTVRFHGGPWEGFRAVSIAGRHGLPLSDLRRYWYIKDGELKGPEWEMTFVGSVLRENLSRTEVGGGMSFNVEQVPPSTSKPPPPHDEILDPGIAPIVKVLRESGVETCQSCQSGEGHSYPEPTIEFYGDRWEGLRAVEVVRTHAFPLRSLRCCWNYIFGELEGPIWDMTFDKDLSKQEH